MTIQEIKQQLQVSELKFQESIDSNSGAIWHKFFNNDLDNRFSLSVPSDVFDKMLEDRSINILSLQYKGEKVAKESGLRYKSYIIVIYKEITGTF